MPLIRDDWLYYEAACLTLSVKVMKFHTSQKWKYFERQNKILTSKLIPSWVREEVYMLARSYDEHLERASKSEEGCGLFEHIPNKHRGNMMAYDIILEKLRQALDSRKNNPPQIYTEAAFLAANLSAKATHPEYAASSFMPDGYALSTACDLLSTADKIQQCKTSLTRSFAKAESSASQTFGDPESMTDQIIRQMILDVERKTGLTYNMWLCRGNDPIDEKSVNDLFSPVFVIPGMGEAVKFGKIFFFRLGEKRYYLSSTHVDHLIHFLKGVANLVISDKVIPIRGGVVGTLFTIFDYLVNVACVDESVDKSGYYVKGAKALAISSVAANNFHIGDPESNLLSAFDKDRTSASRAIMRICLSTIPSTAIVISFLDIYKLFPHPDCNISACFESIDGLKKPNKVDSDMRKEIKGVMVKNAYLSMKKMKMDVRGYCMSDEKDDVDMGLQDAINATNVNLASISGYPINSWSNFIFNKVIKVPSMAEVEVKIGDKASQESWIGDLNDIKELGHDKDIFLEQERLVIESLKSSNDVIAKLKGSYKWDVEKSLRRFEGVIALHEAFEAQQRALGIEIDEISHEDLAAFLFKHPAAAYICGTEPKYGEVHKFITRMFYMAERDLKVFTQRVERIVRRVSGRQSGVSITKSYRARMKDMEQFASAMINQSTNHKLVFVSFDMSEFSKKFPMATVRDYGEMLSQITGDKLLKRLDLVFRSCIVIHNTRGYFGYKAGCKGGFEGFLNFAWSSIHASVMEAAINTTGISGVFLTFSDDGVAMLRFPPEATPQQVEAVITAIQHVYKRSGLIFHIGKTVISDSIWEYLGDVFYKGHMLPSFFKELASIGKFEITKSITSRTDNHKVMVAQVAQLVEKGYPGDLGRFLGFVHTINHVRTISSNMTDMETLALALLPYKVGGYRVPSDIELRCRVDFERDEELLADLRILHKYRHPAYNLMASVLTSIKPSDSQLKRMLITGASFPRSDTHVDPEDLYRKAIDAGIEELGMAKLLRKNPLTDEFIDGLMNDIKYSEDVDLVSMFAVFRKSAVYNDYTASLSMVKSASFLKLVGRDTIKRLQGWDNRRISKSIMRMKEIFSNPYFQEPESFIHKYREAITSHMAIVTTVPIMSVRDFLQAGGDAIAVIAVTDSDTMEQGRIVPYDHCKVIDWEFTDPPKGDSPMYTSLSWSGEDTGSSELYAERRTIEAALSYIATYPPLEGLMRKYLRYLNTPMPAVLRDLLSSVKRRQVLHGAMYDANVRYNAPYNKCTSINYTADSWRLISSMDRSDKNRITRILKYCCSEISYGLSVKRKSMGVMQWKVLSTKEFIEGTMAPPPQPQLRQSIIDDHFLQGPANLVEEIKATINEIEDDFKVREQLMMTAEMPEDQEISSIIHAIYTKQLENALFRALQTPSRINAHLLQFPSSLGPDILRNSILMASIRLMIPQEQGLVKRACADHRFGEGKGVMDYDVIRKLSHMFSDNINRIQEAYPSLTLWDLISKDSVVKKEDLWYIAERVLEESITIYGKVVRVVISDDSNIMTEAVTGVKDLYREAISSTITTMLSHGKAVKFDEKLLGNILGGSHKGVKTITYDNILDSLYIIRSILRESSHRSKPYNETTLKIESLKFYTCLFALVEDYASAKEGLETDLVTSDEAGELSYTEDAITKMSTPGYLRKRNPLAFMKMESILQMRREAAGSAQRSSDHLDLLDKGLKPELRKRLRDHMMYMLRNDGEPYSLVDDRLSYVENLGTAVYHTLLYKVAQSVKVIRRDTASEVYKALGRKSASQVESMIYQCFATGVSQDICPLDRLSSTEVRILSTHLANCASSSGFLSVHATDGDQQSVIIDQCITSSGLVRPTDLGAEGLYHARISSDLESKEESELFLISVQTQYRLAALDTYFSVIRSWGGSATVHYDSSTHDYTVLGCMATRPQMRISPRFDYSRLSVTQSRDPHYSAIWSVSDEELVAAFAVSDPRKRDFWKSELPELYPSVEELAAFFEGEDNAIGNDKFDWSKDYTEEMKKFCEDEDIDDAVAYEIIRHHYHQVNPRAAVRLGIDEVAELRGKVLRISPDLLTAKQQGRLERIKNYLNEVEDRVCTFGESLSVATVKRGVTTGHWDLAIGKASFSSPTQMIDAFYASVGRVGTPMPNEIGLIAASRLAQGTPTPRAAATITACVLEWMTREEKGDVDIAKIEMIRNSVEKVIRTKNPSRLQGNDQVLHAQRMKNVSTCRHWILGVNPLPGPDESFTNVDKIYRMGMSDSIERMQSTVMVLGRPFAPPEVFRSQEHKLSSNLDIILFRPIEISAIDYGSSSEDEEEDYYEAGFDDSYL